MQLLKDFKRGAVIALGFVATLGVTALVAQSLNEFAGGELISASKINANFANIKGRLDNPLPFQSVDGVNHQITSTAFTDVNGLELTVTTNGSPVWVGLGSRGTESGLILMRSQNTGNGGDARITIVRDGTIIYGFTPRYTESGINNAIALHYAPGSIWTIDNPGAGTYTYKIQARCNSNCDYIQFNSLKLMAMRFNEN